MQRHDGRQADMNRPVTIERDFLKNADGSVLITVGDTRVICSAVIEDRVPGFQRGTGKGWISAEYSMLPASTETRKIRDRAKSNIDGRSVEIQRLIGRAMRSVVDLEALGERTIWIDCDVIQADGGTRTASITGAYVALEDALRKLCEKEGIENPLKQQVAAISVGIPAEIDEPVLDLDYHEDSGALVDMNVVMTDAGEFIEIQGTGEDRPFNKDEMNQLLELAETGIKRLFEVQKDSYQKTPVILATQNEHKVREIAEILGDEYNVQPMQDYGIVDEIVEDGETIDDNAKIKVHALRDALPKEVLDSSILLADDTGLFVDYLDGEPGVFSARYAGENCTFEDNNQKLLKKLEGVAKEDRGAHFKTSIAMILPSGEEYLLKSDVPGFIAEEIVPGETGFGYDPIFIEASTGQTFSQMSEEEKNQHSHRRAALDQVKETLGDKR